MANGNSAEARRLYQERHRDRQVPHHNLFQLIHQRLWENVMSQFGAEVMFTDEASFSRDEGNHQQQFSVNVWAGIVGDHLIGPHFLPNRLNGADYRQFLEEVLPELLEDVPLQVRENMYFMHDGAPAHFSLVARQYLDDEYQDRWIGRGGPHPWPPRSPELNCLDFFFWGHLKTLVYATPVENVDQLRERIVASCDIIRNTPEIFLRVRQSMRRRIAACIEANGGHFQHLI
ncbi:uncharacterized protein LOC111693200 [Anoplophora glabripennis]|uniref:uncharacterized protein LOC111693200 n=1 Tax=Anoplophora glabripennis TaxID=217634 RepID=UPI000C78BB02|nr:uncharacterized protein LOC111693200 [Anoplophora glabripennis]